MLVYTGDKSSFIRDLENDNIEQVIGREFKRKLFRSVAENEIRSWRNSLHYMGFILKDQEIPEDSRVSIEYQLPIGSKRIDFILTGRGEDDRETAVIIELKQWEAAEPTDKEAVVKTYLGKSVREVPHPSYQAWSYAASLEDFCEPVFKDNIQLKPCAYLHNLKSDAAIRHPSYASLLEKAPAFLSSEANKLKSFIKKYVKHGDKNDIMYRIDHGRIRPSKRLADEIKSLLMGNSSFIMIDDQKVVYETALDLVHRAQKKTKQVLIVKGGPGTGKSVVATNLLARLINEGKLAQYVTKTEAPRLIYAAMLKGTFRKTHIDNLFRGSGSYIESENNCFDALLVDEAHRLINKSRYNKRAENQIKEIIHASKCSVFFIDPYQRVSISDIGSIEEINRWAEKFGAAVTTMELASQFRCNGSDGYLSWLDQALQIHDSANNTLEGIDYDFRVFDSPAELFSEIRNKNISSNKARLLAGYCWEWKSKKDPEEYDIEFPEYDFHARWNLASDGQTWIMKADSINEIGCIHTSQGLEVDYAGVIIGPDLVVRNGEIITDPLQRASNDQTVSGSRQMSKKNPEMLRETFDGIIRNTYRTLMTRGMKGCYIWCSDSETNAYFKQLLAEANAEHENLIEERYPGLSLSVVADD